MEFYDRASGVLFESYVKCISATKSEEIQKKVSRSPTCHRNIIQNAVNTVRTSGMLIDRELQYQQNRIWIISNTCLVSMLSALHKIGNYQRQAKKLLHTDLQNISHIPCSATASTNIT